MKTVVMHNDASITNATLDTVLILPQYKYPNDNETAEVIIHDTTEPKTNSAW